MLNQSWTNLCPYVCIPSIHSIGQGLAEDLEREGQPGGHGSPSVAEPTLVLTASRECIRPTSIYLSHSSHEISSLTQQERTTA